MINEPNKSEYFGVNGSRLLSTSTAADQYGVPERTLRDWASKNKIPHMRVGKLLKFDEQGLAEFIELREICQC